MPEAPSAAIKPVGVPVKALIKKGKGKAKAKLARNIAPVGGAAKIRSGVWFEPSLSVFGLKAPTTRRAIRGSPLKPHTA